MAVDYREKPDVPTFPAGTAGLGQATGRPEPTTAVPDLRPCVQARREHAVCMDVREGRSEQGRGAEAVDIGRHVREMRRQG
jgi:hypothetical protein